MRNILLTAAALLTLAGNAFAADLPPGLTNDVTAPLQQILPQQNVQQEASTACDAAGSERDELGRRGCCSHHHGVCGCENGRTVCCDGTLSPSCTCRGSSQPIQF